MAGLAELLLEQGVLDDESLARAEAHRTETGANLAQSLVALGLATESDLVRAFAASIGLAYAEVAPGTLDPHAVGLLDVEVARELTALPIGFGEDGEVVVAIGDPAAREELHGRLSQELGLPISLALAPRRALVEAIDAEVRSRNGHSARPPVPPVPGPAAAAAASAEVGGVPSQGAGASPNGDATSTNGSGVPTNGAGGSPKGSSGSLSGSFPPSNPAALGAEAPKRRDVLDIAVSGPQVMAEIDSEIDLDALLVTLVERGGSDLHLTVGIPPAIRVNGELTHLDDYPNLQPDELQKLLYAIMTQKQREAFENDLELDMSYSVHQVARFRVNIFQQRDAMGAVMRTIPFEILPLEDLGIPEQVSNFAYLPRGFVLVTGPTGSGKSTTLASVIDLVNRNRASHIMTVEDPIEFLHHHKRSVVNQREVGTDTHGFATALKHVLRQDPDVILVGEMRDLETIQIALTAAETGHLVFGTLHTQDAPQSIDRIIDVFPPHQQEQIRVMLAGALKGVVCQTLIKTANGKGRTAACEVMVTNSGIKNLIREGKTHQIYSAIQAGARDGMVAMDQSLAQLVKAGRISYDAALEKCNNVNEFNRLAGRA
ncbi:MAG: PilT/PilU family type 4a pilus ATPase [Nitriliruptoraceae bacterium]